MVGLATRQSPDDTLSSGVDILKRPKQWDPEVDPKTGRSLHLMFGA